MKGTIAEPHFDMNRNMVSIIRGKKRYIMMSPEQCKNIYFFDKRHPSRRHSMIDLSQPDGIDPSSFPKFKSTRAFEVVLGAGDILYVGQQ
jgi:hypothetical protein